jgi:hypothetical protein
VLITKIIRYVYYSYINMEAFVEFMIDIFGYAWGAIRGIVACGWRR